MSLDRTVEGATRLTTICTDGRTMASDSRATCGDIVSSSKAQKLHRLSDGSIIGGAGTTKDVSRAIQGILNDKSYNGDYTLLRLFPNGEVWRYESCTHPIPAHPPAAIGSGWVVAITAMDLGATPKEAVKAAIKRDVYSGGRVMEMSV